jgi:hypothetical protein
LSLAVIFSNSRAKQRPTLSARDRAKIGQLLREAYRQDESLPAELARLMRELREVAG